MVLSGFRMITFDCQAGPFQNFSRSQVMVIGRSVSFSDPAQPPGGAPQNPPHIKKLCAYQNPKTFWKTKIIGKKTLDIFRPPPPPPFCCAF